MKLRKRHVEEVRKEIVLYVDREVDGKCDTTDDAAKMAADKEVKMVMEASKEADVAVNGLGEDTAACHRFSTRLTTR